MEARDAIEFEEFRLGNGLTVFLHPTRSGPRAAVVLMVHAGSKNERPGRTGLAHLFEHIMFKGSAHIPDGDHFRLLQQVGAMVNGSTTEDRTVYYDVVPSGHLELALFLEANRFGHLLPALSEEKFENQRDVVRNERRQNYDNQPYGMAVETIAGALFPRHHPYSWPVIGFMEDLSAASLDDARDFFITNYSPSNASLAIAGQCNPSQTMAWVERYFGDLAGPLPRPVTLPPPPDHAREERLILEDRVHLPRLYLTWPSAPFNSHDDIVLDLLTIILTAGRNSRLYRSLVYGKEMAQSVSAYQDGMELAGVVTIQATAKPERTLESLEVAISQEIRAIAETGVTERELERSANIAEMRLVKGRTSALEIALGLSTFFTLTGSATHYNTQYARLRSVTREQIRVIAQHLAEKPAVTLSIIPRTEPVHEQ